MPARFRARCQFNDLTGTECIPKALETGWDGLYHDY